MGLPARTRFGPIAPTRAPGRGALEFAPAILRLEHEPPPVLPRAVLWLLALLVGALLAWAALGRLEVVAVAEGRLIPQSQLKIIQPAEGGTVRELLVREGERVRSGQVLARMDMRLADADARSIENDWWLRRLQVRRIDAELGAAEFPANQGDPPGLYAQVAAQHRARRRAHEAALAEERAVIGRSRQEMNAARETREKLSGTLPMAQEQEAAFERLAREGFAGKLMVQQRRRERIEAERDLGAQAHRVESAAATIDQAERRMAQLVASYRSALETERLEAESQVTRLSQELEKLRHRRAWSELLAPADGVIKDLATYTQGSVLAAGTVLMTLVPEGEPLLAEVWLQNQDAGFVRAGQGAKLKLVSYPFQKFGTLEGRVLRVSADSSERPNQGAAGRATGAGYAYRAQLALPEQELRRDGTRHALVPGMQLAAEILLYERTVLEYLLSPLEKTAREAGRER